MSTGFPGTTARSLFALLPLVCSAASAATFVVTKQTDSDDGVCDADCSLREAISAANASPGPDVVRLQHMYYRLSLAGEDDDNRRGDLDISDDLQLRGPEGAAIDADGIDRVLQVLPGARVELVGLVLRNGFIKGPGAGLHNAGELTLRRVRVLRNRATGDFGEIVLGGGIYNLGHLRVVQSVIDQNAALTGADQFGGQGGGIYNAVGARLWVYDTNVRDNQTGLDDAFGWGAGVYNGGFARIERSFFRRNTAGDGDGGAIANRHGGVLALINSTLSANGHDGSRGAIANGSRQQADDEPPSTLSMINVTIADNAGGGLFNTGRVEMRNTLIAGNYTSEANDRWYESSRNCTNENGGTIVQSNVLLGADGTACLADVYVDNRTVFSVVLEHLRYLGGPAPVHALRQGSGAIDAGDNAFCPPLDQRGGPRPLDGDGDGVAVCDIGAMELGSGAR